MALNSAKKGLTKNYFTKELFSSILLGINPQATLVSWTEVSIKAVGCVTAALSDYNGNSKITGFVAFNLKYKLSEDASELNKTIVIKSKSRGENLMQTILSWDNFETSIVHAATELMKYLGHLEVHLTELQCVRMKEPSITAVMPDIYWSLIDEHNDIFAFAMEYLDDETFTHIDPEYPKNTWGEQEITTVLDGMSKMHSVYYNKIQDIPQDLQKCLVKEIDNISTENNGSNSIEVMITYIKQERPDLWDEKQHSLLLLLSRNLPFVLEEIKKAPWTLIHFDATYRNMCFRKEDVPPHGKHKLCLYDWEFARLGPVQTDLVQFLFSVLPENSSMDLWEYYIEKYETYLQIALNDDESRLTNFKLCLENGDFRRVLDMCAIERLVVYLAAAIGFAQSKTDSKRTMWFFKCFENCYQYVERVLHRYNFQRN